MLLFIKQIYRAEVKTILLVRASQLFQSKSDLMKLVSDGGCEGSFSDRPLQRLSFKPKKTSPFKFTVPSEDYQYNPVIHQPWAYEHLHANIELWYSLIALAHWYSSGEKFDSSNFDAGML